MFKSFDKKLNRDIIIIQPGEYYVTNNPNEAIATVLGSCVSVCLTDSHSGIGGMNHFMLPGDFRNDEIFVSKSSRYGMFAMESLINEMMKKGAKKENFTAKIFGGGHVLNFRKADGNIPESNISFARTYLAFEEIRIAASDVGGTAGRKIIFMPDADAKVFVKKITHKGTLEFINEEIKYKAAMFKKKKEEVSGGVTLFKN